MDERVVRRVQEHYARHANQGSTREALIRRRRGPALPLKQFHNRVKEKLIHRFCFGVEKVLDLCCGRGGDIRKWDISRVHYVKGVDVSEEEIQEAQRRLSEYQPTDDSVMQIEFESTELLGRGIYEDAHAPFDVATCFFALHYFMATEAAIDNLFLNVAKNLKQGGYFICTCPDGKRVLSALAQSRDRGKLQTPMLTLVRRWSGSYQCFGSAFSCAITDTVTEGTIDTEGSYEYLVFTTPLKHIGAKFGLKLIQNYGDQHLDDLFDQEDRDSEFKHFFPQFRNSDPSLQLASALNMAFVFQKVSEIQEDGGHALEAIEKFETTLPPLHPAPQEMTRSAPKRKISEDDASQERSPHSCKQPRRNDEEREKPEDSTRENSSASSGSAKSV